VSPRPADVDDRRHPHGDEPRLVNIRERQDAEGGEPRPAPSCSVCGASLPPDSLGMCPKCGARADATAQRLPPTARSAGFSPGESTTAHKVLTEKVLRGEGHSSDEARRNALSQAPDGYVIVHETVLREVRSEEATGTGATVEEARAKASELVPEGAIAVDRHEEERSEGALYLAAFSEAEARRLVRERMSERAEMASVVLLARGRKGFLGLGKAPHEYEVRFVRPAEVVIRYRTKAVVRVVMDAPERILDLTAAPHLALIPDEVAWLVQERHDWVNVTRPDSMEMLQIEAEVARITRNCWVDYEAAVSVQDKRDVLKEYGEHTDRVASARWLELYDAVEEDYIRLLALSLNQFKISSRLALLSSRGSSSERAESESQFMQRVVRHESELVEAGEMRCRREFLEVAEGVGNCLRIMARKEYRGNSDAHGARKLLDSVMSAAQTVYGGHAVNRLRAQALITLVHSHNSAFRLGPGFGPQQYVMPMVACAKLRYRECIGKSGMEPPKVVMVTLRRYEAEFCHAVAAPLFRKFLGAGSAVLVSPDLDGVQDQWDTIRQAKVIITWEPVNYLATRLHGGWPEVRLYGPDIGSICSYSGRLYVLRI